MRRCNLSTPLQFNMGPLKWVAKEGGCTSEGSVRLCWLMGSKFAKKRLRTVRIRAVGINQSCDTTKIGLPEDQLPEEKINLPKVSQMLRCPVAMGKRGHPVVGWPSFKWNPYPRKKETREPRCNRSAWIHPESHNPHLNSASRGSSIEMLSSEFSSSWRQANSICSCSYLPAFWLAKAVAGSGEFVSARSAGEFAARTDPLLKVSTFGG